MALIMVVDTPPSPLAAAACHKHPATSHVSSTTRDCAQTSGLNDDEHQNNKRRRHERGTRQAVISRPTDNCSFQLVVAQPLATTTTTNHEPRIDDKKRAAVSRSRFSHRTPTHSSSALLSPPRQTARARLNSPHSCEHRQPASRPPPLRSSAG